jgi:hypothetical protein
MVYIVGTCVIESKQDPRWTWAQSKQPIPLAGLPVAAQVMLHARCRELNRPRPADLTCHVISATGVRLLSFLVG